MLLVSSLNSSFDFETLDEFMVRRYSLYKSNVCSIGIGTQIYTTHTVITSSDTKTSFSCVRMKEGRRMKKRATLNNG